jgi:uncharacterized glyoxalase superfamily protein PhnB
MSVVPHFTVRGAERAVAFYRDAFGAEELSRIPVPDGRLMSVQLRIAGDVVHLADEFPEMGMLSPLSIGGTATVLGLEVDNAEVVFAQAVAAGATVRQPLQDIGRERGNWPRPPLPWLRSSQLRQSLVIRRLEGMQNSELTTVLITGGNKGLGFEAARRLGELGWTVFLGSRDEARGRAATASVSD